MNVFKLQSEFEPAGDQPRAVARLTEGVKKGLRHQTLLGVTGSGKTFTVANVIANIGKPTLVIAHNKTLAAQLAQEYREFFPDHAVHYFVSYYDYYQPEAYMAVTDTYIEKEAQINKEIERLRHATTQALLTRRDVIVVASVSCIYGLGNPAEYEKVNLKIVAGEKLLRTDLVRKLVDIHFMRTSADLEPGLFRAIGNTVEVMPVNEKAIYRIELAVDRIERIVKIDAISRVVVEEIPAFFLFPAKHFISSDESAKRAFESISVELKERLAKFEREGKMLEAERLKRRTTYDLALIREIGYVSGIENYSRHFDGRSPGEPPYTLIDYFPRLKNGEPDFLTVIDESHVTVSQIAGMEAGDASRKSTLIEHGFRLPSAKDNRPLTFTEFDKKIGQTIYTSATPGKYELEKSTNIVEQIIRPTGLVDPEIVVKPIIAKAQKEKKEKESTDYGLLTTGYKGQVYDFIAESARVIERHERALATTLTKKMAEDLTDYLVKRGIKAKYLHSDIETLERIEILTDFRKGKFDVLVGVNLLREGLDLPEVSLIGILDADKEGFLRSETSLIQTIGRAARNVNGRVVLYADMITGSMERAMGETNRRRAIQIAYNMEHGITPQTIIKKIADITEHLKREREHAIADDLSVDLADGATARDIQRIIKQKERQMSEVVKVLDFETAALLRDEIILLNKRIEKKQK